MPRSRHAPAAPQLFPADQPSPVLRYIPIDRIAIGVPLPNDPDFVESVRTFGVIQPIAVVQRDSIPDVTFIIIDGTRRYRALREVSGHATGVAIPALVYPYGTDPSRLNAMTLIANQQRAANPIGEVEAIRNLLATHSEQQIAEALRLPISTVRRRARLTLLTRDILRHINAGLMTLQQGERVAMSSQDVRDRMHAWCIENPTRNVTDAFIESLTQGPRQENEPLGFTAETVVQGVPHPDATPQGVEVPIPHLRGSEAERIRPNVIRYGSFYYVRPVGLMPGVTPPDPESIVFSHNDVNYLREDFVDRTFMRYNAQINELETRVGALQDVHRQAETVVGPDGQNCVRVDSVLYYADWEYRALREQIDNGVRERDDLRAEVAAANVRINELANQIVVASRTPLPEQRDAETVAQDETWQAVRHLLGLAARALPVSADNDTDHFYAHISALNEVVDRRVAAEIARTHRYTPRSVIPAMEGANAASF